MWIFLGSSGRYLRYQYPPVRMCARGSERYGASLSIWSTISIGLNLNTALVLVDE